MYLHLERALVYANGKFDSKIDFLVNIGNSVSCTANGAYGIFKTLDLKNGNYIVVPGFADVHVHLRE
ncbi:MAG: dihydroorotase, partial [Firmicutes bacterium]|nr:dihydroorotase [Bacillota bacterium]